jgi:L-idonate 5-dehydrogenase
MTIEPGAMASVCVIHGARDLRIESATVEPLAPNQVRLRLGAGGICGSDLHYFSEGRVGAFVIREPLVPGHEASGVVAEIGAAVTRVAPGQKVAINPSHPCRTCDYCREGRFNLCRSMFFLGSASVFPHAQGLFREAITIGESQLTPIHEPEITLGEIACAEPLSIGLHGVRRAGDLLGKTVLITGGGTIGCMSVIAARLAGAARVIVCDLHERALQMARTVGADHTVLSGSDALKSLTDSADVAIEAAGHPAALDTCLATVRRGGRIVQVGTLPSSVTFPANSLMVRELDYVGAFRAEREFDMAVQAIRTRRADVRPLITEQLPLARSKEAFELALDRTRSTKVQLVAD